MADASGFRPSASREPADFGIVERPGRWRFTLRSLLIVTAVVAALLAWLCSLPRPDSWLVLVPLAAILGLFLGTRASGRRPFKIVVGVLSFLGSAFVGVYATMLIWVLSPDYRVRDLGDAFAPVYLVLGAPSMCVVGLLVIRSWVCSVNSRS